MYMWSGLSSPLLFLGLASIDIKLKTDLQWAELSECAASQSDETTVHDSI